ncbi:hypothetical protein LJC63_12610 [Ruminococcaceae bacterium OttesenSCG-928-L11]|nr:hypothetical protein [Ruminococcaceae bacterium OttesenSCG-928-L11]
MFVYTVYPYPRVRYDKYNGKVSPVSAVTQVEPAGNIQRSRLVISAQAAYAQQIYGAQKAAERDSQQETPTFRELYQARLTEYGQGETKASKPVYMEGAGQLLDMHNDAIGRSVPDDFILTAWEDLVLRQE